MTKLMRPHTGIAPLPAALLTAAALAIAYGGTVHLRLLDGGYDGVPVVGVSFLLNGLGSAAAIALLATRRPWAFAAMGSAISLASILALVLSRGPGFFGFVEHGWDGIVLAVLISEVAATILIAGAVLAARVTRGEPAAG